MKCDGKKGKTKKSSFVLVRKYQIVKRIECKINVGATFNSNKHINKL